jgi:hypothetical protein
MGNKVLNFTIEYKVEPENADMQGVIERLNESGYAKITDVVVEEDP